MDNERWARIETLYHAAAGMPKDRRPDFLRDACADDQDLRGQVESLLLHDELEGSSLDRREPYADLRQDNRMIGKKLAHYQITMHLGSGGMGDVYQATD